MPTISTGILTGLADSFYGLDNQLRIEVTKSAEIFILQAGKDVFDDRWWQVGVIYRPLGIWDVSPGTI